MPTTFLHRVDQAPANRAAIAFCAAVGLAAALGLTADAMSALRPGDRLEVHPGPYPAPPCVPALASPEAPGSAERRCLVDAGATAPPAGGNLQVVGRAPDGRS
jgi:hypothetical protein